MERCPRPPALPPAHLAAPPPRGSGSGAEGGISGIVYASSLPPLPSTFCSIIARLLSLPFRLIRCGAASGEGSGSPAAGLAPAAPRENERPLPAGRSPADARTGRCALRFVSLEGWGEAGGGRGRSGALPIHLPGHLRGGRSGAPEGEWGEGGGGGGVEGGELGLGRRNPFRNSCKGLTFKTDSN